MIAYLKRCWNLLRFYQNPQKNGHRLVLNHQELAKLSSGINLPFFDKLTAIELGYTVFERLLVSDDTKLLAEQLNMVGGRVRIKEGNPEGAVIVAEVPYGDVSLRYLHSATLYFPSECSLIHFKLQLL